MNDQKIKYILTGILAVIFTWIIHEFAHWLTSELLGYETIMRLNISFIAPWLHGYPIKTWLYHTWYRKHGIIREKPDMGIRLIGFNFHYTEDSVWSGISFSINV